MNRRIIPCCKAFKVEIVKYYEWSSLTMGKTRTIIYLLISAHATMIYEFFRIVFAFSENV
jgi:hypothetical protein